MVALRRQIPRVPESPEDGTSETKARLLTGASPGDRPRRSDALRARALAGERLGAPSVSPRMPGGGGREDHVVIDLAEPATTMAAVIWFLGAEGRPT